MKVEFFDPTSQVPSTLGLCMWCGRHDIPSCSNCTWDLYNSCFNYQEGVIKLPFPIATQAKMKGMENAIVLWCDKDIVVCKQSQGISSQPKQVHFVGNLARDGTCCSLKLGLTLYAFCCGISDHFHLVGMNHHDNDFCM